ncbi:MAG: hypothetical protein WC662_03165 [Candidatus Paceibacterota bacterium]|jgi:hypothetical protein
MNKDSETKICQNCKNEFEITQDDFNFFKKLNVSPPTWCPRCRFIRKLTYINERSLYKRNCANCQENIISMFHPDVSIPVWCLKCHISDTWDARDYAKKYDFSRNFFEQFKDLKYSVPHRALDRNERNGPGCEYSNYCFTSKNIYLSYGIHASEDIKYSKNIFDQSKNCLDSLTTKKTDRCYEVVQTSESFDSSFLVESEQCISSHFLFNCANCTNCCLSSNIRNKSNVFRNKQLSKEEYQQAISNLKLNTYIGQTKTKEEFKEMVLKSIHRYAHIKNCMNSTGDFIENAKNCSRCYGLVGAENLKNCFFAMASNTQDSQDLIFTGRGDESYESTYAGRGINKVVLSACCGSGSCNLFYCDSCRACSDCFGCVGLSKKQYCIFNKQYSKEEYFELIEKIKKHMNEMIYIDKIGREYGFGEFFPTELSPFAYNETVAYEENLLSKDEIITFGYKWRERELRSYIPTVETKDLPDSINDVNNSICDEIIGCINKGKVETQCTLAFRILPDELTFYRQMKLPIPRFCPNCRYYDRKKWVNTFNFYLRECMCELSNHGHEKNPRHGGVKCQVEFETMYAPERPEIIYCKDCYQKEFL